MHYGLSGLGLNGRTHPTGMEREVRKEREGKNGEGKDKGE